MKCCPFSCLAISHGQYRSLSIHFSEKLPHAAVIPQQPFPVTCFHTLLHPSTQVFAFPVVFPIIRYTHIPKEKTRNSWPFTNQPSAAPLGMPDAEPLFLSLLAWRSARTACQTAWRRDTRAAGGLWQQQTQAAPYARQRLSQALAPAAHVKDCLFLRNEMTSLRRAAALKLAFAHR